MYFFQVVKIAASAPNPVLKMRFFPDMIKSVSGAKWIVSKEMKIAFGLRFGFAIIP
jgi:hypothetical protein